MDAFQSEEDASGESPRVRGGRECEPEYRTDVLPGGTIHGPEGARWRLEPAMSDSVRGAITLAERGRPL